MASVTFNISDEMAKRLQEAGYLENEQFIMAALQHELERRTTEQPAQFSKEEMLAAMDELYGACEDADWTMNDILAMKREERLLEDRKLKRL
jgi:hypothetical protein